MSARQNPARRAWTRDRIETLVFGVLAWVMRLFLLVITVVPLVYMVALSMRPLESLLANPLRVFPTLGEITFASYQRALASMDTGGYDIGGFLLNSLYVAVGTIVLALLFSVLGGYAVSRFDFPGKRLLGMLFLSVYLFPAVVIAIPLFVIFTGMGLRGSLAALVVIYLAQTVPVALFMLRNFFENLPEGIEEAAALDGAGGLRTLWHIVLPLALPALAATGLFVFIVAWNEFLFALLFLLESRDSWTVSIGIALLDNQDVSPTVLLASSVIMTLPIVLVFLFAQRVFAEGLSAGATKE
ncbi:carbohydrate ABC transporter membrane protein 2 (CUT1 family) [Murinocardiopsis flavida]|uniref:Carbohydrate ABC transporter membrane protein 2 (CUT1 family) n=1 Tax=Murinocardiopsis flavida TaxID=645275 RepID=A0A2P8DFF6_9ACTN|nr:carbohydrate ABC transporter permease [Murinocardiopsis flavida]PSK95954.1 carbohydrate ABC transporter membrane protein 2 (CUT1 family) [Murinocardiopsis flavida]